MIELERLIERIGVEYIVVFIVELIIGVVGGVVVLLKDYYKVIKEICDYYDILFIVDEVMIGFGCIGVWFVMEYWGVELDIMIFGKGLGVGYILMVVIVVSDCVMELILCGLCLVMSGYMLSVNLLFVVMVLVVIEYMEKYNFFEKIVEKGEYLIKGL